jgi:hypothetical protein
MTSVRVVTHIWTADDVLFAPVRARRGDGRELVRDLLAAADDPGSLVGVTPAEARICAAQILVDAGETDAALASARQALDSVAPADLGPGERLALAHIFAVAGDADRAVELAAWALTVDQVTYRHLGSWIALVLQLAETGRFAAALRLCDAAIPGSGAAARQGLFGALGSRIGQLVELTRQQVLDVQAEAEAAGTDFSFVGAVPSPDSARADAADPPAWPAVVGGHLGWWPEPEYTRVIQQVPELGAVLGHHWRQHTSRTESALRASSDQGQRGLTLVALTFADFVHYLMSTGADPSAATVLTGFAGKSRQGQAWPPTGRKSCWCGTGSRYRDCCGRPD